MNKTFFGEYQAIFLCLKHQQAVKILYFKLRLMYLKSYSNNTVAFFLSDISFSNSFLQRQPPRGVPRKSVLKICSKFTGEHPCRSAISIKLQSNFIEIAFRRGSSPVNLLPIFRTPFPKSTYGWLLSYEINCEAPIVMQLNYQQNSSILYVLLILGLDAWDTHKILLTILVFVHYLVLSWEIQLQEKNNK